MTDTQEPTKAKKPIYTRPKFILSMIAAVIFLILIFQNWAPVSVNLFFMTDRQVPAAIMYVAFSVIGFIVGWIVRHSKKAASKAK